MTDYATPGRTGQRRLGQEHLDDPGVRFVEVDVDTSAYDQSHIPGAVAWNWTSQLSDGVRRDIVSRDGPRGAAVPLGHRAGYPHRALRRQQQLVRRLGLLAAEAVRLAAREHPQRRAQVLGRQRPAGDRRRAHVPRDRRGRCRRSTAPCAPSGTTSCAPAWATRAHAGGRALARGVQRRGHRAPRHDRDGPAGGPHPGRHVRSRGPRRSTRTARSRTRDDAGARTTPARASPPTRTSSPTAASGSARRTPGSCSTSCSATRRSATTTAPGRSGARSSTCPSRRARPRRARPPTA